LLTFLRGCARRFALLLLGSLRAAARLATLAGGARLSLRKAHSRARLGDRRNVRHREGKKRAGGDRAGQQEVAGVHEWSLSASPGVIRH
jgi:hypothetical protein